MAQTNVQAFSGDVEISSNLAVDTNTLFVDSVANRVGLGTTNPDAILEVYGPDLTGQSVGTASLLSRHVADDDGVLNTFGIVTSNGGETMGLQTQIDGRTFASDISGGWAVGGADRYALSLQPYKGRVGIGKTDPYKLLHLHELDGEAVHRTLLWSSKRSDNSTPQLGYLGTADGGFASGALGLFKNTLLGGTEDETVRIQGNGNSWFKGGNVGVGTNNPDSQLSVYGSGGADNVGVQIGNSDRKWRVGIRGDTTDQFAIQDDTAGVMRLQIDSSGQVGVNCSPSTMLEVKKSSDGPAVRLGSNDGILEIAAISSTYGYETVTMQSYIDQGNSGTFSAADRNLLAIQPYSGRVGIGLTEPSHTVHVKTAGSIRVALNTDSDYSSYVSGGSMYVNNPSTSGGYEHFIMNNAHAHNGATTYFSFRRNNGQIGSILTSTGATINFNTGSDYRLKENIVPMPNEGLAVINNLRPKTFNFKTNPRETVYGFIAHELQEHIPMAVSGEKDEMRDIGNVVKIDDESSVEQEDVREPEFHTEGTKWVKLKEEPMYQGVDASKIVPWLVKAVQELYEENQTLKTRLDALESA